MFWDRFDIIAAYMAFFADYHNGMNCPLYQRLSYWSSKEGAGVKYYDILEASRNCQAIYDELVANYFG